MKKGRATFFQPKTIVANFLHFTVFLQSDIQLYFKMSVCGAPFSYLKMSDFKLWEYAITALTSLELVFTGKIQDYFSMARN